MTSTKIQIDYSRDELLSDEGKKLLKNFYMLPTETSPQEAFARAAESYCMGDYDFAQRIYDYASKLWFMFASPVLSNAPADRKTWKSMPISCFLQYVPDNINGQMNTFLEMAALSVSGGGVGSHNGIRAISEKAPGPIPYMKTLDAGIGYYRQGSTRRGSLAYYMDIDHPDIVEHIKFRIPTGGDVARKSDNRKHFHNAVNITNEFTDAVINDELFDLKCPHSGEIRETVPARDLWEMILETRVLTGEPYLHFIDVAREAMPQTQKELGLTINGSNLCIEIELATSEERTAVCALSSVNAEKEDEWKNTNMIADLVRLIDNVIQIFIDNAPDALSKAVYSASRERSIGLGVMGFHGYLMKNMIPFESGGFGSAVQANHKLFRMIKDQAVRASQELAKERGEAPDMVGTGMRNAHLLAIAPNSNSSAICNCTPSIEPIKNNAYVHTTRAGTFLVKNPHLQKHIDSLNLDEATEKALWKQIVDDDGSIQNVSDDILPEDTKKVFKTANEIDQHWLVQHGEDRAQYICQGQSLNLFFPSNSDRAYVNSVYLKAMKGKKLKSLYYHRTENKQQADTVKDVTRQALQDWKDDGDESVCIACEG